MKYRIELSIAGLFMFALCFLFIKLHYKNKSNSAKILEHLVIGLFIADSLDAITAVTISFYNYVPIWLNYVLMIALYVAAASCMSWLPVYVGYTIDNENGIKSVADKINNGILIIFSILCITTPFTKLVIKFTDEGEFEYGVLHLIIYGIPFYFFVFAALRAISHVGKMRKKQVVATLAFILVVTIGSLMQMLLLTNYLLIYFSCGIAVFLMLFSIETSDNLKLQTTLVELEDNKNLLEKARNREEKINKLIHEMTSSASWGLTFDEEFNVVDAYWSDEFFWMLGYEKSEIEDKKGSLWQDSLHPEDKEKTINAFNNGMSNIEQYDIIYRLKNKDGEYKWYRGTGDLTPDDDGKGFVYAGIIRDVNDEVLKEKLTNEKLEALEKLEKSQEALKEAVVKAESADRAKSDFLANMSHEIRTPINAVLGMNELIQRESTEKNVREYSANVAVAGEALLALINDVLDFSKIEAGRMELAPTNYEMSGLLVGIKNMLVGKFTQKGLEFNINVNSEAPNQLYGDEIRIRQILVNILTNSVKYTQKGSVILFVDIANRTETSVDYIFSVKDTGIGIKPENLSVLFEAFRRIDLRQNRKVEGTGLGLSITKSFVELMGGTISVESVYGEGSTFTVVIPQVVTGAGKLGSIDDVKMQKDKNYSASFVAPDARILLVDDVEMNIKVVKGLLKQTKVQIDTETSGAGCLERIKTTKYDVILLDHMMPEMDGIETMKRMRSDSTHMNQSTPVIMLTANAVIGAKEEYLDIGFSDYLSKPVKYDELESVLKKYCN